LYVFADRLEIATCVFPHLFLPIGAAANAVKGLAWMAGGSARSAFNVSFASDNNIADITAKATSQMICTSIVGTSIGLALASVIHQSTGAAFGCYAVLAALHLWTGYESAKTVPLATLNPSRLGALALITVRAGAGLGATPKRVRLPSPSELAKHDPILPRTIRRQKKGTSTDTEVVLVLGSKLSALAEQHSMLVASLLPLYRNRRHILFPDLGGRMHLILHEDATFGDSIVAALQAAAWKDSDHWNNCALQLKVGQPYDEKSARRLVEQADAGLRRADRMAPGMIEELQAAGWDTRKVVFEAMHGRRARW